MTRVASITFALLLAAAGASAQSCTTTGSASCGVSGGLTVGMTVGRATRLEISGNTTLTAPTAEDFNFGSKTSPGPTLTIRSNAAAHVTLVAATSSWAGSPNPGARQDKPASDLEWSNGGSFTKLSSAQAATIWSSTTATSTGSATLTFRTAYAWNLDVPGTYTLNLTFAIIAP